MLWAQKDHQFQIKRLQMLGQIKPTDNSQQKLLEAAEAHINQLRWKVAELEAENERECRDVGVQASEQGDGRDDVARVGILRSQAKDYVRRLGQNKGPSPGQVAFLYEEHSQLANHLSFDNQKLLKIFEEKQESLKAMSHRMQQQKLQFLEESQAYQQWKVTNLQSQEESIQ